MKTATLWEYQLPFKTAMQFKQHRLKYRHGLILLLTDSEGDQQLTEISPLPGFSHESLLEAKNELLTLLSTSLDQGLNQQGHSAALQFALSSRHYQRAQLNTVQLDNIPLLQGDETHILRQYVALDKPHHIKLKVARNNVTRDIALFQQLCQLNPKLKIRCDANQAWNEQQATQFCASIKTEQLDYIEEPTNDHCTNIAIANQYKISIALDETLQQPSFNYQHHPMIKAFIIKPTIIGSKEKIDRLVSLADQHQLSVSISSSFETIVGIQQLQSLANHYAQQYPTLPMSLGIDTLKYFKGELLIEAQHMLKDCQQLELIWTNI